MLFVNPYCHDTIDLAPEEFLKMRLENPEEIESFEIVPPVLGRSSGFGKIRVKLTHPRYEVLL